MKWLLMLVTASVLAYLGWTVPLGKRTFFGHVNAIWATSEVQDMKQGIEQKAGPAVERVKRGVEAGVKEAAGPGGGSGSGSGSAVASGSGSGT